MIEIADTDHVFARHERLRGVELIVSNVLLLPSGAVFQAARRRSYVVNRGSAEASGDGPAPRARPGRDCLRAPRRRAGVAHRTGDGRSREVSRRRSWRPSSASVIARSPWVRIAPGGGAASCPTARVQRGRVASPYSSTGELRASRALQLVARQWVGR